jgi:serine/threonine-protein kinase
MAEDSENLETVALGQAKPGGGPTTDRQRFVPGALLASRYRIVSRLGKGGMGEVFRADDLILGQPVALKFLPESASGNLDLLKRFYDEVRIARQVSHANVCRVYDIGEIEGQPYLSMEYIDGEDLSSLLRRIGRLPADKAVEFARKMCAGLAAAHKQGVLHRDLKPGNIMIDARGEPRITDFGLAALAAGLEGAEIRNGTPVYMAPEQLEGREVSVRSDLYALGLVFYEMFTGKLPHQANTVAEILVLRKESRVTNPSALVSGIDPAVERVILRCLDPDPKQRPESALALAASLPGGDPLAAALAAGETPSPEVVAASGSTEGLSPKVGGAALAAVFVGFIALLVLLPRLQMVNRLPLENPPEVLTAKTRDILRSLGYIQRPADFASGFYGNDGYFEFMRPRIVGADKWREVLSQPPAPTFFWYRESPRALAAQNSDSASAVSLTDPEDSISGMVSVEVDLDGRLLRFAAVPPQQSGPPAEAVPPPDWTTLFSLARLDPGQFKRDTPEWTTLAVSDTRVAWSGIYPGAAQIPVRIEAASFQGRPIFFEVIWPWTTPSRMAGKGRATPLSRKIINLGFFAAYIALIVGACFTARHNWKASRGDIAGATRVGIYVASLSLVNWVLRAHHVDGDAELSLLRDALGNALFSGGLFWIFYLALEPWVRRYWPQTLVTWSRVLQGYWRDPLVGRDLLFSVLLGVIFALFFVLSGLLEMRLRSGAPLGAYALSNLTGVRQGIRLIVSNLQGAIGFTLMFFLVLFFLRALLKKQWMAAVVFVIGWASFQARQSDNPYLAGLTYMVVYGFLVLVMLRFGLLASALMVFMSNLIGAGVVTNDFSAWYGQSSWIILAFLGGVAIWGFRLSTTRKRSPNPLRSAIRS